MSVCTRKHEKNEKIQITSLRRKQITRRVRWFY